MTLDQPFVLDHHAARPYQYMGAQCVTLVDEQLRDGKQNKAVSGVRFVVYAPHAMSCHVIGDFNQWDDTRTPMKRLDNGLWHVFVPHLAAGERYKLALCDAQGKRLPDKADPWGYWAEPYPLFASVTYDHHRYQWHDAAWLARPLGDKSREALAIYELHLGSWQRDEQGEWLNYRQLAARLIPYVLELGYTHIELMPVAEHPFYGSWGYQPIGLFAPTSRYGTPDDFKYFVDQCHLAGIGVILDWVPAHFPADAHGLADFDGSPLFHDPDPRRGWHPDWHSYIYDLSREHVQQFLIANALYWLDRFHLDGLRVDAVSSLLYLDYSRAPDQWIPNRHGGNINEDAVRWLQRLNDEIARQFPHALTIAEESTTFPNVSAPTAEGGLGFDFKWNMGWMHDSLTYIRRDPIYRQYHHNELTFPLMYAHSEQYVLPLSHDEVVYGKGSMLGKMPSDAWQQYANLRAYYGYMYGQPGKKLHFMGAEFGQRAEWNHDQALAWDERQDERHGGLHALIRDLNHLYRSQKALHECDGDPAGFEWCLVDEAMLSIIAHERISLAGERVLVITNFTPVPRPLFPLTVKSIAVKQTGCYQLLLNTDDRCYAGSHYPTNDHLHVDSDGLLQVNLPPLATLFYRFEANTL